MTPNIQFRYGKHVDMDYKKNVTRGYTGKILRMLYLDYLDFKEYNYFCSVQDLQVVRY